MIAKYHKNYPAEMGKQNQRKSSGYERINILYGRVHSFIIYSRTLLTLFIHLPIESVFVDKVVQMDQQQHKFRHLSEIADFTLFPYRRSIGYEL